MHDGFSKQTSFLLLIFRFCPSRCFLSINDPTRFMFTRSSTCDALFLRRVAIPSLPSFPFLLFKPKSPVAGVSIVRQTKKDGLSESVRMYQPHTTCDSNSRRSVVGWRPLPRCAGCAPAGGNGETSAAREKESVFTEFSLAVAMARFAVCFDGMDQATLSHHSSTFFEKRRHVCRGRWPAVKHCRRAPVVKL